MKKTTKKTVSTKNKKTTKQDLHSVLMNVVSQYNSLSSGWENVLKRLRHDCNKWCGFAFKAVSRADVRKLLKYNGIPEKLYDLLVLEDPAVEEIGEIESSMDDLQCLADGNLWCDSISVSVYNRSSGPSAVLYSENDTLVFDEKTLKTFTSDAVIKKHAEDYVASVLKSAEVIDFLKNIEAQKTLDEDPEYKEYLRLKDRFENDRKSARMR